MSVPGNPPLASLDWTAATDIGRRRQNNEDSWGVFHLGAGRAQPCQESPVGLTTDTGLLLILSDGMGGALAGEEASRFCVQQLPLELAARAEGKGSAADWMREAFIATHTALVARSKLHEEWRGMGATLSALWIRRAGELVLGHIGDSRIYRTHGPELQQLSEDQNVGAGMVRRGELTVEAASRLKFRSLLEQAMGGDGAPIAPQVEVLPLATGTGFALCSDGLYGPLRGEVASAMLAAFARPSLATGAADLIAAANEAGGPDNITVILARAVPAGGA